MKRILFYMVLLYALVIGYHQILLESPVSDRFYEQEEEEEERERHKKGDTDQPSGYLQFHEGIRTRSNEAGPAYKPGYKWKALQKALIRQTDRSSSTRRSSQGQSITWVERGPANVPGRTRAVLNVPGDPTNKTWLAGAATGGIWRTTDGGITWDERSINFPAMPISSFASTRTGSVIYAGTGECISSFFSSIGDGIFMSTDQGLTWTQLSATKSNADFSIVTRVIVHPDNADILVAATAPHDQSTDKTSSIMRSTDAGLHWQKVLEVEGLLEQVTFAPNNFNIQYAAQNGKGVWKSLDGGQSWVLANTSMTPSGRVELAVSPVNPLIIFASAEGTLSGTTSDLYYSTDGAASWNLVELKFNDQVIDFLDMQGYYNNTILADPFTAKSFYVGGVSLFKTTITSGSAQVANYRVIESNTAPFMKLLSFAGNEFDHERLRTGPNAAQNKVEVRFGPGISQRAHRFLVPVNKTNGLSASDYTYQDYVDVPFEVWDVSRNKQLSVSFRDQDRNGKFDLLAEYLTDDGENYLTNSREYIYVHDFNYSLSANTSVAKTGGQEARLMYNIFPSLAADATWEPASLPSSKLIIEYIGVLKFNSNTNVVSDAKGTFNSRNRANQVNLTAGVHADHHALAAIIENLDAKTYRLLLGNDGGVFASKPATQPGITEGDWAFKGFGFNTGQFYGADKNPVAEQYIGGMQDNGTRISAKEESAGPSTSYQFALEGDGFETIWNSKDPQQLLGTRYYGFIAKSKNGGDTWETVRSPDLKFPFVTKLANSKDFPDRVFTVGSEGVYVSENFGDTWKLTPVPAKFIVTNSFFLDVEVSRANPNIVWAGSGMNNSGTPRNLFVSTNAGKSFSPTNNYTDVVLGNITKLASHPTEANTAYALFSFSNGPKILRTTDLGQSWQDISGFGTGTSSANGFPDVAVYCLYVRPDNPNILWAGTEIGIVESLDNGVTWNLLHDFPHVTVWDMKGQDNEVVLATHGRGIWSAIIDEPQSTPSPLKIMAAGSTPRGKFAIRLNTTMDFDSVKVFTDNSVVKKYTNLSATTTDIVIESTTFGNKNVKALGYKNQVPYQSMVLAATHHQILNPRNAYSTQFRSLQEVTINGMAMQNLEGNSFLDQSLQSNHNYSLNRTYEVLIRAPITVSSTFPRIFYQDIAITEPGKDSVVLEATANGLDWRTLKKYDAAFNPEWLTAYQSKLKGNANLYVEHDVNFGPAFQPADVILFRFRMLSNDTITSWGWAINQVNIQQFPTAVEQPQKVFLNAFPNPAKDILNVEYAVQQTAPVSMEIFNAFGARVVTRNEGVKTPGTHRSEIPVGNLQHGTYLFVLNVGDERTTRKILRAD
jgi:photosystem II stability/assembly factor-like uncharacterized protein